MWWHERNLGFRSPALYTSMQTQQAVRSSLSSSAAVVTLFAAIFQLELNLCNCTNNINGFWALMWACTSRAAFNPKEKRTTNITYQ